MKRLEKEKRSHESSTRSRREDAERNLYFARMKYETALDSKVTYPRVSRLFA